MPPITLIPLSDSPSEIWFYIVSAMNPIYPHLKHAAKQEEILPSVTNDPLQNPSTTASSFPFTISLRTLCLQPLNPKSEHSLSTAKKLPSYVSHLEKWSIKNHPHLSIPIILKYVASIMKKINKNAPNISTCVFTGSKTESNKDNFTYIGDLKKKKRRLFYQAPSSTSSSRTMRTITSLP